LYWTVALGEGVGTKKLGVGELFCNVCCCRQIVNLSPIPPLLTPQTSNAAPLGQEDHFMMKLLKL